MRIDPSKEKLRKLSEAARKFPGGGRHVSQLYRYANFGSHGVRLETLCVGGTLCTSDEAVNRFIEAVSIARGCSVGSPSERVDRQAKIASAERKLAAAGI